MPSGYGEKDALDHGRKRPGLLSNANQGAGSARLVSCPIYFDFNLRGLPTGQAKESSTAMAAIWKAGPNGKVTDLGTALAELQKAQVDPPLRAVFMITDGCKQSCQQPPMPSLVARQLEQLDQPIIVVGLGPRSEKSQLRDLPSMLLRKI